MPEVIIAVTVAAIVFAFFGAWVAKQKHRKAYEGFIVGLLFGPLGVLVEAALPHGAGSGPGIAITGVSPAGNAHAGDNRRGDVASWWPALGVGLSLVSGAVWAIGVQACGAVLDDFGGDVSLLSSALRNYAWPLAFAFVALASACLLGAATSMTAKAAFAFRLGFFLLVAIYLLLAVIGCALPLVRLISALG